MSAKRSRYLSLLVFVVAIAGCSGAASNNAKPPLTKSPALASTTTPSNTPTGRWFVAGSPGWLAYQTTDGANDRVHLVGSDGSRDHAIAPELPGRIAHPDFSPDGRRLVIDQLTSDADVDQIYVGDGDGKNLRLIARCGPPTCLDHWEPAWSPDGRELAISVADGNLTDQGPTRFGLAIVDVRTQSVTVILDHTSRAGQDHFARWSPNGQQLVFWRERPPATGRSAGLAAVFRIDRTGGHLRQLTPWSLNAGDPDWSPDGSEIVFSTHPLLVFSEQAQSDLFVMSPDGAGRRQITHNANGGPRAAQPHWTPDGHAIVYVQTGPSGFPRYIYAVRTDGSDDTPVLTDRGLYTHPDLQPAE